MGKATLNINDQLVEAAKSGHLDEVRKLVSESADVNHGQITSFLWAYFNGHKELAKYLLAHGGNVNHDRFEEGTLLTFSAFNDDIRFLRYLLGSNASVNHSMPKGGETALHQNQTTAAQILVEHGADVNHKAKSGGTSSPDHFANFHGETPLHIAAVCTGVDFIDVLLKSGATKTIRTNHGKTAVEYAKKKGRESAIVDSLRP